MQAKRPRRLPVVLTPAEVRDLLMHVDGATGLVAQLLYGRGMRLMEALRLLGGWHGPVYLPHALAVKYPEADKSWAWQWVFPSPVRSVGPRPDARTGLSVDRRHHVFPESVQRAVREAARLAAIDKPVTPCVVTGAKSG